MANDSKPAWANRRLTDVLAPGLRVILVGINPGVMSATTGHHFAGPTNRFWGLLYEAGIVPQPITHEDDVRLPEWGIGMTNLIARPSPGIDDLSPAEYLEGWTILEKKIEVVRPDIVAFVGVTMYRALWRVLNLGPPGSPKPNGALSPVIKPGFQKATVHGARLFVLPNPSGRNAHFSYDDMLRAFRALARAMRALRRANERQRVSHANGARRRSGARESVSGSSAFAKATADTAEAFSGGVPRGDVPRKIKKRASRAGK